MMIVATYFDTCIENEVVSGECYELLKCPKCDEVELQSYSYCDAYDDAPYFDYKTLYPSPPQIPMGLPKKIQAEYESALIQKRGSPNAYGVLMGRVLELVCDDKNAKGKTLGNKLSNLASRKEFPPDMQTAAWHLNSLRIFGAHATVGNLTAKEVPIVENLTRAILEYLYSAPHLVKEAEKALNKLKGRKGRPK
jgi:hypothetical protein